MWISRETQRMSVRCSFEMYYSGENTPLHSLATIQTLEQNDHT